ncbi:MAG TPA: inner membrane CreD family protein [Bryobacteraceae bacterium]|nr:inner membrane CreD family protein [Bryobacteraceae bacterium]
MFKQIAAITFILICASVAWFVLGATIDSRTYHFDDKLRPGVASVWGAPQEQCPPTASFVRMDRQEIQTTTDGHTTTRVETHPQTVPLPLEASRMDVALALEHRQKGLLWYSTYVVDFSGVYTFRNTSADPQTITYTLKFPAEHAIYDGLVMEVDGRALPIASNNLGATTNTNLTPGQMVKLHVAYRSHGLESWRYRLGDEVSQARDFTLHARTNFKQIDFPLNTLSPTDKRETHDGWDLTWRYSNVISGFQIGVTMPERLQPGPLAGEISYFAPVSLLLFFFLLFIITTLRSVPLHPMNYFFLAAAFFSFHLLLAYLVDHIGIHIAFLICSVVSIFLVVSYLRLVVGPRLALVEAGGAQFIYLVLFSYSFFLQGFTGLAITLGCIVTLFVVMQMTGRIRWTERFARR